MSTGMLSIIAIASIVIWLAVSNEVLKTENSRSKLITLMTAGTLTTVILTISLFQSVSFKW
ncbi:hypothetical protein MKX67_01405 [Cytobacillus sp. FSL W7-1323]|uniref:Uncharacterized protein n=1 Tax=Cytobacillus kochii TaxID=859143 RepID=A0A248TGU8_9BACI|nr:MULTISPECIES: hypothetical protein [Cytobacillus]ASV67436.1 hypothetical protein CKF48_08900 [Cytobacillus kochii]MCA1028116.1 hypothetical protein [Cytobacillus kochii]MCM3324729.1 hypothetical protein [Cytobacillus kochii]MCM3347066.1 hypothetical protein [Cytobacillus kochii]MDM5205705.1 hypothetical protein [Cytobacillus kochii]